MTDSIVPLDAPGPEGAPSPQTPFWRAVSDKAASWLRTVFPVAWSALIAWLVTRFPALEPWRAWAEGLGSFLLTLIVTAGVYPLFRRLERIKVIPDWLVQVFLGSAKRPLYVAPQVADQVQSGQSPVLIGQKKAA